MTGSDLIVDRLEMITPWPRSLVQELLEPYADLVDLDL